MIPGTRTAAPRSRETEQAQRGHGPSIPCALAATQRLCDLPYFWLFFSASLISLIARDERNELAKATSPKRSRSSKLAPDTLRHRQRMRTAKRCAKLAQHDRGDDQQGIADSFSRARTGLRRQGANAGRAPCWSEAKRCAAPRALRSTREKCQLKDASGRFARRNNAEGRRRRQVVETPVRRKLEPGEEDNRRYLGPLGIVRFRPVGVQLFKGGINSQAQAVIGRPAMASTPPSWAVRRYCRNCEREYGKHFVSRFEQTAVS